MNMLTHLVAAIVALSYAWTISHTTYVTTAAQFVTPLILILLIHTASIALRNGLNVGFSERVFRRSAVTAFGMVATFFVFSIVTPKSATAADETIQAFLMALFCLVVLLSIVAIAAMAIFAVFRVIRNLWRKVLNRTDGGPETRFFDFASLLFAITILSAASFEGIPDYYSFEGNSKVVSTQVINAKSAHVWAAMDNATSPDFPLPNILSVFPQPISVMMDEGTSLGANRKVRFQGREGVGVLSLRVVERDTSTVIFAIIGDTSPYVNWITFQTLTYRVIPQGDRTRLDVSLRFERVLAPSWFFTPIMNGAARLAMDVLARDVKIRAESASLKE